MTFPVYNLPNGVSHHVASYLSRKDHLELCLVSKATQAKFYPIFQERVGHTEASIDHLQELMVRCSLLDLNPEPVLHQPQNAGDPILMEYRPRWTTPVGRVHYVVGSMVSRWYAPKMRQVMENLQSVGSWRLICTVTELRKKCFTTSPVGQPDATDVLFFLRAFEVADPETIRRAYEAIPNRVLPTDFLRPPQDDDECPFLFRLITKACIGLFQLQPVHASHEAGDVEERKLLLRRTEVLWDCVLGDYHAIDGLQPAAKHEANYWPIVLQEYFRYLQQLYRPGENKKAYSCMHKQVVDAPVGLYSCLKKLEQPANSHDAQTFKSLWSELLTYAPAYSATIACLLFRLRENKGIAEPAGELLEGYFQELEERGNYGDYPSFRDALFNFDCSEAEKQLHKEWEDSWRV